MVKAKTQAQAIAAFCVDCLFDPGEEGSALDQVRNCSVEECPLWPFRPTKTLGPAGTSLARYRRMGMEEK